MDEKYELEDLLLGNGSDLIGCVFPHEYIPATQEETKTFICVETIIPKIMGSSTETVYLYVWAFSHKELINTYSRSGIQGTRPDILAADIDKLLNGNAELQNSIGKLNLVSVNIYKPALNYYGRVLVYEALTFNRSNCT